MGTESRAVPPPRLRECKVRASILLNTGIHRTYPALQEDWNRHGADSFTFEVLDVLPPSEEPRADPKEELGVLESLWLERLRPYGDAGYNARPS